MKKTKESPAFTLLRYVWDHSLKSTKHSWTRLNQSMHAALQLAIESGMEFAADDFIIAFLKFSGSRWNGYGSDKCESFYTWAVAVGNASAIKAFERWKDRKPFLIDAYNRSSPIRATVGTLFRYGTEWVKVTSFDTDCLIACTYKESKDKHGYRQNKIAHRYRITHEDIYADRAARKAAQE